MLITKCVKMSNLTIVLTLLLQWRCSVWQSANYCRVQYKLTSTFSHIGRSPCRLLFSHAVESTLYGLHYSLLSPKGLQIHDNHSSLYCKSLTHHHPVLTIDRLSIRHKTIFRLLIADVADADGIDLLLLAKRCSDESSLQWSWFVSHTSDEVVSSLRAIQSH